MSISRRANRADHRRARGRERRRALLVTTAILAASTIAGVSAAGSTYALLNDQRSLKGGTIQAGSLNITINNKPSETLGDWVLSPNTAQAKAFTISNASVATPSVLNATISASAAITSTTAIGANVLARLTPVANTAACTTGLSGAQSELASFTNANLGTIAKGASAVYCLELSLKPNTPVAQAGQGVNFTLTVGGAQNAN